MHLASFKRRQSLQTLEDVLVHRFEDLQSQFNNKRRSTLIRPPLIEEEFLNSLLSLVPKVLTDYFLQMSRNTSLNDICLQPELLKYDTVACIADLSGFCAASESLCEKGEAGLDDLRKGINKSFSDLLSTVKSHGGDVIDFAGDALIIAWTNVTCHSSSLEDRNKKNREMVSIAAICAKNLVTKKLRLGEHEIGIHIGLNFGEMHFALIGGTNDEWRIMSLGPIYRDLCKAVDLAKIGQVAVTGMLKGFSNENMVLEPLYEEIKHDESTVVSFNPLKKHALKGKPRTSTRNSSSLRRTSGYSLSLPAVEVFFLLKDVLDRKTFRYRDPMISISEQEILLPVLMKFIPQAVSYCPTKDVKLNNYELQPIQIDAEIRDATVVFVKLGGVKMEESLQGLTDLRLFQDIFTTIQTALARYDGLLRQFILDDKGIVLIAAFGVANFTHVDDPMRALDFTGELCYSLGSKDIHAFAGITTGRCYTGPIGDNNRQDFALVGDVVNLSARLMGYACKSYQKKLKENEDIESSVKVHKNIICDVTTKKRASGNLFVFKAIEQLKLKGKKNFSTVYKVFAKNNAEDAELNGLMAIFKKHLAKTNIPMKKFASYFSSTSEEKDFESYKSMVYMFKGESGTGKSSILRAVKHQSLIFGLDPVLIKLQEGDESKHFSGILAVLRGILLQFIDQDKQTLSLIYRACEELLSPTELINFDFVTTQPHIVLVGTKLLTILGLNKDPEDEAVIVSIFSKLLSVKPLRDIVFKKPIFLAIDDVQFMDEISWALLMQFLRTPGVTAFCCCTIASTAMKGEPELWFEQVGNILRAKYVHPIIMSRLNRIQKKFELKIKPELFGSYIHKPTNEQVSQFILEQFPSFAWTDETLAKIIETAESDAQIALEIARSIEANVSQLKNETVNVMDLLNDSGDWDKALITSYQRRIDTLPKNQRKFLKRASVITGPFTLEMLLDVSTALNKSTKMRSTKSNSDITTEAAVEIALEQLVDDGFFKYHSAENIKLSTEARFVFANKRIQDTCYQMLLPDDKKTCHFCISQHYIKRYGQDIVLHYQAITRNFVLAELYDRAIEYYIEYLESELKNKNYESSLMILNDLGRFAKEELIKSNLLKEYVCVELGKFVSKLNDQIAKVEKGRTFSKALLALVQLAKRVSTMYSAQNILRNASAGIYETEAADNTNRIEVTKPVVACVAPSRENFEMNVIVEQSRQEREFSNTEKTTKGQRSKICTIM